MKKLIQDRNNAPIHASQERMRDEAKVDAKKNAKSIENVRKMQENLREKFIEMNNFICECERKKAAIQKKIAIEQATDRKLDKQLKELEQKAKRMDEYEENELKPAVEKLTAYEEMVQKTVDESNMFETKEEFIDSCKALSKHFQTIYSHIFCIAIDSISIATFTFFIVISALAQSEVKANGEANLKELEQLRADIVKTSNEASLQFAGLENQLDELEV